MIEPPVLSFPFSEDGMALDGVQQILGGIGGALEQTDAWIAEGRPAPLEEAMRASFMPGLQGLIRAAAQLGAELAVGRESFVSDVYDAQVGAAAHRGPSNVLATVLKLRGIANAIVAAVAVLFDAAEMEAIGIDRASAALCAGTAFVDDHGRVIAQTSSANLAKTSLAET
jgi:hypothetical protein